MKESVTMSLIKKFFYFDMNDISWTWTLTFLLLCLSVWMRRKKTSGVKNLKVALPEECHWLYGHTKYLGQDFLKDFGRVCVDAADEYGLSSFYLFRNVVVCVTRADHVQAIVMASSFREKIPIIGKHFDSVLGEKSLTLLMKDEWKFHRRVMAKSFHYQHLMQMTKDMNMMGERFATALLEKSSEDSGNVVDMVAASKAVTLDIIGMTVFGIEFNNIENSFEGNEIAQSFDFLLSELTRRQFHSPFSLESLFYCFPSENNRKFKKARDTIDNVLNSLVHKKQEEIRSNETSLAGKERSESHHDILRYLLESYMDENISVSGELVRDNLVTLLFAGYDTTSIALSYLLYSLALHPHVEARALAEIKSVLLPQERPSYEQLTKEFVYCSAVIEEVLRLYPPAPLTTRNLEKDVTLRRTTEKTWGHPDREPVTIPAGTAVYLPIWWLQRSELNFHDPLAFNPDRFMPENKKHLSRYAHMAFSGGPRDCIGRRFAMLELLSLFIALARKLKFQCVDGYVLESEKVGVVQRPKGGLPLIVTKRVPEI